WTMAIKQSAQCGPIFFRVKYLLIFFLPARIILTSPALISAEPPLNDRTIFMTFRWKGMWNTLLTIAIISLLALSWDCWPLACMMSLTKKKTLAPANNLTTDLFTSRINGKFLTAGLLRLVFA